jgi:hypothetical protein
MKCRFPEAVEKGEIKEYLAGYGDYAIVDGYAAAPTDTEAVFRCMEEALLTDAKARRQILDCLVLLAYDAERGWVVMDYVDSLLRFQAVHKIMLVTDDRLRMIGLSLKSNRVQLMDDRHWIGNSMINGLWGYVERMDSIMDREFGVSVLATR